jgi:hypothetical protein
MISQLLAEIMDRLLENSATALLPTVSWLPDLAAWEQRPRTQIILEKSAATSPYVGGSDQKPRDIRTLRGWRKTRRGLAYLCFNRHDAQHPDQLRALVDPNRRASDDLFDFPAHVSRQVKRR